MASLRSRGGPNRRAGHAELGVPRREAVPTFRAVIPGAREGDQAEHRAGGLVPVAGEQGLMALATGHPRPPVARIGG